MLINELSKKTGVTIHTIRYYENLGLLRGKTDENIKSNNYKSYDDKAVERLMIVVDAKEVGFTLAEIRKLLDSWYGENSSHEEQIAMFTSKIAEIDAKIKQFKQVKKKVREGCKRIAK